MGGMNKVSWVSFCRFVMGACLLPCLELFEGCEHFLNMMISSPSINCYNNGENFNECKNLRLLQISSVLIPIFGNLISSCVIGKIGKFHFSEFHKHC